MDISMRERFSFTKQMHCGLAIARLETQLAEHQAFLERFRSSLQKEEYGPQS
jgi:hypothetical protein